ncbi:MAG TPA: type VI secretion system protein TssA [Candidatus Acidoferrales bacterium]|nr:type VI secretion system protein TssA [Candidatus Acidoferrales bacterium]
MPTAALYADDFFGPVSPGQPAGSDLRWTAEWDRIKEARRSDDELEPGKWAKKDRKTADWRLVEELTSVMLRERTKDLQLSLWLTEAGMKLHGFPGLRDGLRLTRELMVRYWDRGLYPPMEDGPEDRAGPFEWLDSKLVDSIKAIPITAHSDGGPDYSLIDLQDARRTGSEASCVDADGEIDTVKRKTYDAALAQGHISQEMFDNAVAGTKRAACEDLYQDFQQAHDEFKALEKVVDEKFGDVAPNLSGCRNALNEIREEILAILEKKRREEPDPVGADLGAPGAAPGQFSNPVTIRFPLLLTETLDAGGGVSSSWQEAEALIRSGQVDRGLAQMVQVSAKETSGRNRFQRKLLLAEVCLATKRERLARSILEELAEQIDKLQLEAWESSELIAGVWSRLYKLYKQANDDRAGKLYERLCRLDPWQALSCGE